MKKHLIPAIIMMAICSCKHKEPQADVILPVVLKKAKVDQVKFPQPVVKADKEELIRSAEEKNTDGASPAMAADTSKSYAVVEPEKPPGYNVKDTVKKIIKQGDIRFEAKNIAATRKALLSNLSKLGGYADEDNQSLSADSGRKEYNIKARIPAKNFDVFVEAVSSGASRIDYKHISVSDVTTEYIDTKTRLNNQKILEATYIGLLKKASRMKDILDIEDKITDTRTEIESQQGQLNYMSKQIAYSTLDITFYTEAIERETGTGAGYKLLTSFSEGWTIMQALFYGLISLWPLDTLAIAGFVLVRNWRKRRKAAAVR
jgi:hypothetical protein